MKSVAAIVCLAMLVAAGCSGGASSAKNADRLKVGDEAPLFTLTDLRTGETYNSGKEVYDIRATVIVFWSMACPVCRDALLEVEKVYDKYAPLGVRFVSVNFDIENLQGVRAFVEGEAIAFPTLMDQGRRVTREYKALDYSFSVFVVDARDLIMLAQYDHPPDLYDVLAKVLDSVVGDKRK